MSHPTSAEIEAFDPPTIAPGDRKVTLPHPISVGLSTGTTLALATMGRMGLTRLVGQQAAALKLVPALLGHQPVASRLTVNEQDHRLLGRGAPDWRGSALGGGNIVSTGDANLAKQFFSFATAVAKRLRKQLLLSWGIAVLLFLIALVLTLRSSLPVLPTSLLDGLAILAIVVVLVATLWGPKRNPPTSKSHNGVNVVQSIHQTGEKSQAIGHVDTLDMRDMRGNPSASASDKPKPPDRAKRS